MKKRRLLKNILILVATVPLALASPVLTFNEATGSSAAHNDQSVGWQFNVTSPITLTGLGWWDETKLGIPLAHMVGIWNPGGTLLAAMLIPAGAVAPLDGQFRTMGVGPLVLVPGNGYIVGGQEFANDTERLACGSGGVCDGLLVQTLDPRVSFVNATFSDIGGFQRPTLFSVAHEGFYGPSFSVAPIPEPATMLLLGVGLVGLALLPIRRTRP